MTTIKKDNYWSIIKGIGIIGVVVGHCGSPLSPFVYLFHLSLFFFVSGFFFKKKYVQDSLGFFKQRIKSLWVPYIKYGVIFIIFHNFFINVHVQDPIIDKEWIEIYPYTYVDILKNWLLVLTFQQPELMLGPLWFVVALFWALVGFLITNVVASFFPSKTQTFIIILASLVAGILGCYFCYIQRQIRFRLDISMLIQPVLLAGFLCQKYWTNIQKYINNIFTGIFCFILLILYAYVLKFDIDISYHRIENPLIFYSSAVLGVSFSLCLSKFLNKISILGKLIGYMGENSFHIMALHFLSFKVVSYIYILLNDKPILLLAKFPYIDGRWWVFYSIAGIVIPLLTIELLRKSLNYLKKNLKI